MKTILFPCPKCGKPDSSWDGSTYCGPCEEAYQRENAEQDTLDMMLLKDRIKDHAEDCECLACCLVYNINPNR